VSPERDGTGSRLHVAPQKYATKPRKLRRKKKGAPCGPPMVTLASDAQSVTLAVSVVIVPLAGTFLVSSGLTVLLRIGRAPAVDGDPVTE
jgi:hypothetical protein